MLSVLMAGTIVGMVFVGASRWRMTLAPVMAVVFTQFAFLAHEMAYKQAITPKPVSGSPTAPSYATSTGWD